MKCLHEFDVQISMKNISLTLWQSHCLSKYCRDGGCFFSDHQCTKVSKKNPIFVLNGSSRLNFISIFWILLDEKYWFSRKRMLTKMNEVFSFLYPIEVLAVFSTYLLLRCGRFRFPIRFTRVPGIKYVVDKHPTNCGLVCTDAGRVSKTVPYDCLHLLRHFFSGWNLCFCFL